MAETLTILTEEVFKGYQAENHCHSSVTYEQYKKDVENTIEKLKSHFSFISSSYCTEYGISARTWYKIPYMHKELWKHTVKLVTIAVRNYIQQLGK